MHLTPVHTSVTFLLMVKTAKDKRLNLRLTQIQFKDLKRAARDAQTTVSELVRKGIEWATTQIK